MSSNNINSNYDNENLRTMLYDTPPENWHEGLPIGSGRLAAMVWGDKNKDVLTLNHEWLWRGVNRYRKVVPASEHLEYVRSLLRKNRFFKGTLLGNIYFSGDGGISDEPDRVDPYQPAGELTFTPVGLIKYIDRSLCINTGVSKTRRHINETELTSQFFASSTDSLIYAGWYTNNNQPFAGALTLSRTEDPNATINISVTNEKIILDSKFNEGISHRIIVSTDTNGKLSLAETGINVFNATYLYCTINIATSVAGIKEELERYSCESGDFNEKLNDHKIFFASHMDKTDFRLTGDVPNDLPLSERIKRFKQGSDDNGLCELYYHYGRYMMLSCTICGELPPNLQGKWNDRINPPWDSDYHMDINLQMEHWLIEPCGMNDAADKLFSFIESFYESGEKAAKELYGCRGIYLPILSDVWGISTPEAFGYAAWIGAAPWMAQHFWQHYLYTGDMTFLRDRAYRFFIKVAEFYEDYLQRDENGIYQIIPSQSPENRFRGAGFIPSSLCISSAMDVQLCYDSLTYAIESAMILGIDEDRVACWKNLRDNLPGFPIGSDGRLLEWNMEVHEEEPGHRHVSHLYGVYPGDLFTPETRPEQYHAARKSLDFRLSHGGAHTGWSRAWTAALMSRFGDSEKFYEHFSALIKDFATISLLDLHPPGVFQIDGNLGGVAAVNDALIQCIDGKIYLLKALPDQWHSGSVQNIKTPGGHTISMKWENSVPTEINITIGHTGKATIYYTDKKHEITGTPGDSIDINGAFERT